MRFFTDQNVPDSVAKTLQSSGYEVTRLREKIATNSPDNLVAAIFDVS
jgi:predicted nuclease of predicted toxin-antitoxin system